MIKFANVARAVAVRDKWFRKPAERKYILKDVSFMVPSGARLAIVGPNGAGKSSTVKLLCGLTQPHEGKVCVNDLVPSERSKDFLKSIGVVVADKSSYLDDLPPWWTVRAIAPFYGLSLDIARERFEKLMETFDLSHLEEKAFRVLSLGERARFEIILAMLHRPSLLVLDEPSLGLDILGRRCLLETLITTSKQYGGTVVITTHDIEEVRALAEWLLVIEGGTVQYFGKLESFVAEMSSETVFTLAVKEELKLSYRRAYGSN